MKQFELTQEIQEQICAHAKWQQAFRAGQVYDEPFNPWWGITELMVQIAEGVQLGWGDMEEVAIAFLEYADNNRFYDETRARHKTSALDTQELVDRWESFKVLRKYIGF